MLAPHLQTELPGTLHLGALRLPVFALFATAGLVVALLFSERTAERVGLSAQKLWDAGVAAVVAAFVISRVQLVAENFTTFKIFPALVLGLPSITQLGVFLTAIFALIWLRFRRVPLLSALDAWAPCVALLTAFLDLGHFFERTEAGMPTKLPWGVTSAGDTVLGHTHPVQLYGFALATLLAAAAWTQLGRSKAGGVAAFSLFTGGVGSFLLSFLRQPTLQVSGLPLDAAQALSALMALAGVALFATISPIQPGSRVARDVPAERFDHA